MYTTRRSVMCILEETSQCNQIFIIFVGKETMNGSIFEICHGMLPSLRCSNFHMKINIYQTLNATTTSRPEEPTTTMEPATTSRSREAVTTDDMTSTTNISSTALNAGNNKENSKISIKERNQTLFTIGFFVLSSVVLVASIVQLLLYIKCRSAKKPEPARNNTPEP